LAEIKQSSDKSFGLVFTVLFAIIAIWPYYDRGESPQIWAVVTATLFLLTSLIKPVLLAPLNRLWTKFGFLLNKITEPIIMGLFFFAIISPIAIIMRLFGKRPLQLAFEKKTQSYWITREQPGPIPESMKQQF
jgi:predicted membrane metal-binding protein